VLPIDVNVEFHDRRADSIGNFINMQGSADSPARRSSIRLGYIGFDRRTIVSFHTGDNPFHKEQSEAGLFI
jgi:hypothetical protein